MFGDSERDGASALSDVHLPKFAGDAVALRSCLCTVHQVARLELGLHMDVSWLQDTSHLFTCG